MKGIVYVYVLQFEEPEQQQQEEGGLEGGAVGGGASSATPVESVFSRRSEQEVVSFSYY
jgi:hypothetical protein